MGANQFISHDFALLSSSGLKQGIQVYETGGELCLKLSAAFEHGGKLVEHDLVMTMSKVQAQQLEEAFSRLASRIA